MQAKDVMTAQVVSVTPATPVADVANIFLQTGISGVPVIDDSGRLCGIVSENDLMRRPESDTEKHRSWWLRILTSADELTDEYLKSHGTRAEHVMTTDVITVPADMPLAAVAEILESHRIKRVPVMQGDKVVGIVSRSNLLQALVARKPDLTATSGGSDDRALRDAILAALRKQDWLAHEPPNPVVTDGVVELWGWVSSEKERAALQLVVEEIPGVRAVRDRLVRREAIPAGGGYL